MKILLCKSHFAGPISGADETLVTYATHLHRAGHRLVVALLHPPTSDDPYYLRLKDAGVEVVSIGSYPLLNTALRVVNELAHRFSGFFHLLPKPWRRSRKLWRDLSHWLALLHFKRCRNYFKQYSADLIHVVTPDPGAAMIVRAGCAAGTPVLYQELGTPHYMPELEIHYERFAKIIPLCSEVAALSPILAQQWAESFSCDAISVLPLLVEDTRSLLRASRQRRAAGVTVGFAARLERGKGPLILVEAFARARRELNDAVLMLAGTGPQEREVRARAFALGILDSCSFPGAYACPEDKSAFMQKLDLFVLPTLAEGTPNSIIEAMAHGLPIIASAVGGIPDMITPETGILVPPGDVAALTDAITLLATRPDLREQMGRAARKRYEKLFSPQAVLPMLVTAYQRLAAKDTGRVITTSPVECFIHPWKAALLQE
jgi:glycosyltransferase involved in cell wall biosynthesis